MEKVANILLVEDDNLDVMDVQRTLDKLNILHKTRVAKNGEEALAMLKQVREDPQMEKPKSGRS
jgi:CheY-like chemotaxis protein